MVLDVSVALPRVSVCSHCSLSDLPTLNTMTSVSGAERQRERERERERWRCKSWGAHVCVSDRVCVCVLRICVSHMHVRKHTTRVLHAWDGGRTTLGHGLQGPR